VTPFEQPPRPSSSYSKPVLPIDKVKSLKCRSPLRSPVLKQKIASKVEPKPIVNEFNHPSAIDTVAPKSNVTTGRSESKIP
jgi:hypothetical protein